MDKVLVKIYLPVINEQYEMWIPVNRKIYNIIILVLKGVNELDGGNYMIDDIPVLYNKSTGINYDLNAIVRDTDIRNATELILV